MTCNTDRMPSSSPTWKKKQMSYQERYSRGKDESEIGIGVLADECCIALDEVSQQLWVGLATVDANSVDYNKLPAKDRLVFDTARKKEMDGLLNLGAYRILSVEESLRFRKEHLDCVLPSR